MSKTAKTSKKKKTNAKKPSAPTAMLKKQHREVKAIFGKLEKGKGDATALLKELADNLAAHMKIEQDLYYPAIAKVDEDLIMESFEEHSLAELGLKRLLATDRKDEAFESRVTAVKELVEHHVEEEEEDLFPKVDRKMDPALLADLGARMEALFVKTKAAGFEATVPKGFAKTSADVSRA
ncbi:MAG: hemerythrin domain-containing protein [Polyangiaceae bacterium]